MKNNGVIYGWLGVLLLNISILGQEMETKPLEETGANEAPLVETPNDYYSELKSKPWLKKHLNIKMALCQHLMYLLVDEDRGEPPLAERIPPWGYPNAAEYVDRIRRNLQALDEFPDLKLNYQFAAVDMESIARDFPDVYDKIKEKFDDGSLDLVGGDFSTTHQQVLSSESNWRQIELAQKVFGDLFGKTITVYARQESGFHQQMPQILKHFGFEFIVPGAFPWAIEVIDGPFEMGVSHLGAYFINGDEFVEAVSLDGTSLPLYLNVDAQRGQQTWMVKRQISRDLYSGPPLWTYFPDLIEIDEGTYRELTSMFDLVFLDEALQDRLKEAPPRAKARLYSHWSYIEGEWADEHLRKVYEAEEEALLAESLQSMAALADSEINHANELEQIWHTILKYQHHDLLWIAVTDLRRKAINYMNEGIDKSHRIMSDIAKNLVEPDDNHVAVFNGLPHARRALLEVRQDKIPGDAGSFQSFQNSAFGFRDLPAGGYRSFPASQSGSSPSKEIALPKRIQTNHYGVEFSETGLIKQITTRDKKDLLKCDEYLGGEIRAMISDGWVDNRAGVCTFYEGDVSYILERSCVLAEIPVLERYFFFKHENVIKAQIEFDFHANEVGYFWLDETKINIYYPTTESAPAHDIPFGYVQAREHRPLFAPNWLYNGGLVYVNCGTVKHWVKNGVIANVVGWGSKTFGNRIHFDFWTSKRNRWDIRLYGKQKIEYYLIPYGKFNGQRIVRDVRDIKAPVFITDGKGERSFYEIEDQDLATTSVYVKDEEVFGRGYRLPSQSTSRFRDWEIFDMPVKSIP